MVIWRRRLKACLLNYRRRSQASCISTHEFRVIESMDPLDEVMKISKE